MIKAIVYSSNSGFTKKYADLLSAETGLVAYTLKEATARMNYKDGIIYLGWLCGGILVGYKKAHRRFHTSVICAVGMSSPTSNQLPAVAKLNDIKPYKLFYLQGGCDMSKLKGIYKCMLKTVINSAKNTKKEISPEKLAMQEMALNGGDYVSIANLDKVLAYIREQPLAH